MRFERLGTGAVVKVFFDAHRIPANATQPGQMQAAIKNKETPERSTYVRKAL